jgi:hypothetical protein
LPSKGSEPGSPLLLSFAERADNNNHSTYIVV